jgi:uncharacterized protein YmfQ (DUF2313 family)
LLYSLLPPGDIWKRDTLKIIAKLLLGLAYEFNRLDVRVDDLLTERDSRYVDELLTEFEAEYGIPEEGLDLEPTIERRRNVIHAKVIAIGSDCNRIGIHYRNRNFSAGMGGCCSYRGWMRRSICTFQVDSLD